VLARTERLPPHDVDAEEAVIGSLLVDGEAFDRIATFLSPQDFYRERNRWIYDACLSLYERNAAINQITVAHELSQRDRLEAAGGPAYLSHLISIVPTSVYIEHYAQIVHRTAMMRYLISAADQIAAIGYEGAADVDGALNKAEDVLFSLRRGQSPRDFVSLHDVLDQYFEEATPSTRAQAGPIPYVLTGFEKVDELLGGLQRSDMIVLAARPSLGKTSLALNIARNAALQQMARVAIFSVEMAKEQLAQRLLASESGVDMKRVRLGLCDEDEERRIVDATGRLSELPIYIDDTPILRVVEMRSKARRLHNEVGIDLIVVDYIQLLHGSTRTDNRVQEMSEISRALKELARELSVPLLAVSQLSRAVEMRSPHIPLLSDLRDSGTIEQDADVVMFIYRDDVYYDEEEWERRNPSKEYPKGIAEIIVSKHRNGPTGNRNLRFIDRTASFSSL